MGIGGERVSSQRGNREREGIQPEWERRSNYREGIGGERVSSQSGNRGREGIQPEWE